MIYSYSVAEHKILLHNSFSFDSQYLGHFYKHISNSNLARFIFQISLERVWVRQERLDLVMFPAVSHCQLLDVMNENDNNDGENIR